MKKLVLGFAAAVSLGLGAFASTSAEAQPYPYYRERPPAYGYYGPRPAEYRHGPRHGYRYAPPPPRCFTRPERVWDGYRWVMRPVRVCR